MAGRGWGQDKRGVEEGRGGGMEKRGGGVVEEGGGGGVEEGIGGGDRKPFPFSYGLGNPHSTETEV